MIGINNLKSKCNKLIDNIEKQMKNSSANQKQGTDDLNDENNFNDLLIKDMKLWLNEAIVNIKIYLHHMNYHGDHS
jgi:hypothetical protein